LDQGLFSKIAIDI